MNKYQRALKDMKRDVTWQNVADKLSDVLGETVHRSDAWNVANGRSSSSKVETALELGGWVTTQRKRYRLAAEFFEPDDVDRFKRYYGIDNKEFTFTDWVHIQWKKDEHHS